MGVSRRWHLVAALLVGSSLVGCGSMGKTAGNPLSGVSLPGIKNDDKALRAAVEKDPFPRAQGSLAASRDL